MDATIQALAEPRRRQILRLVLDRERSSGDIASHFPVTQAAISQHLGVLKAAGLVAERRDGTRRIYRARPEGVAELRAFLDEFWRAGLDRLKREAELEGRAEASEKGAER